MNDLLLRSASVIEANGFVQRRYYKDTLDDQRWRPARQCPVCPRGGIAIAAGQVPDFMVMVDSRGKTAPESDPVAYQEISEAEELLRRYLVVELGVRAAPKLSDGQVIEDWADAPERTQPQVIGALRAAAEYAGRPS